MSNSYHAPKTNIDYPLDYERAPIRLTNRGKIVGTAAVLLATGVTLFGIADAVKNDVVPKGSVTEVAQPGDTLWGIADNVEGAGTEVPIEAVVAHLEATNSSLIDGLQVGEAVVRPESVEKK